MELHKKVKDSNSRSLFISDEKLKKSKRRAKKCLMIMNKIYKKYLFTL